MQENLCAVVIFQLSLRHRLNKKSLCPAENSDTPSFVLNPIPYGLRVHPLPYGGNNAPPPIKNASKCWMRPKISTNVIGVV